MSHYRLQQHTVQYYIVFSQSFPVKVWSWYLAPLNCINISNKSYVKGYNSKVCSKLFQNKNTVIITIAYKQNIHRLAQQ